MRELIRLFVVAGAGRQQRGQGLAEYALILALIAIVAILSFVFLGDALADLLSMIGSKVDEST